MTKKAFFLTLALILVALNLSASNERSFKEEKDFAVPAFSDFFVLGGTRIAIHKIADPMALVENDSLSDPAEIRQLDINRDFQLNDFDVKQFEALVEKLDGLNLSREELIDRFRLQQGENADSAPLLYDLDRDGKFTPYDVDYFTGLIGALDENDGSGNAVDGNELIKKFRERIFPEKNPA